jgi:hypothetical protein
MQHECEMLQAFRFFNFFYFIDLFDKESLVTESRLQPSRGFFGTVSL